MDYLQAHKDNLIPDLRQVWEKAGFKTSGTWEQVFGKGVATDEIFMGWNFARYVGRVVEAGKAEYPLPMYMNAWTYRIYQAKPTRARERRPPCPRCLTSGEPGRREWIYSGPTIPRLRDDVRRIHPIREPAVYTRGVARARKARPERSTPSDAMMRSVTRA